MSLIHLALLAKAIEEQNKRTGARHSSKPTSKKEDDTYSYRDPSVSLETFLDDLLKTDPEATKLFLLLKDCQKQIDDEDNQKSLEEVQRICKEYDEQDKILDTKIEELEATGITLDNTKVTNQSYCSVKVSEGHGFGGYGSYSYNPARYYMGFNGMPLTREMIQTNTNQFQIDLDNFNKENPNLDAQLTEIQTKIAKQKKSIKYSPFNKSKKQSLLTDMLKVEKEIKTKINERTTLEKQSAAFAALTEEQKKAIIAYMDQVANCIVVGDELGIAINASISIRQDYYGNKSKEQRNVHQRMLEKAVETGEFTMEEIESILERVKTTADEHEVGYNRYERLTEQSYTVWPTSPESMFAAEYYNKFYKPKNKTKK
jgi:hypothetical protein